MSVSLEQDGERRKKKNKKKKKKKEKQRKSNTHTWAESSISSAEGSGCTSELSYKSRRGKKRGAKKAKKGTYHSLEMSVPRLTMEGRTGKEKELETPLQTFFLQSLVKMRQKSTLS
jgi:hypothetical protein